MAEEHKQATPLQSPSLPPPLSPTGEQPPYKRRRKQDPSKEAIPDPGFESQCTVSSTSARQQDSGVSPEIKLKPPLHRQSRSLDCTPSRKSNPAFKRSAKRRSADAVVEDASDASAAEEQRGKENCIHLEDNILFHILNQPSVYEAVSINDHYPELQKCYHQLDRHPEEADNQSMQWVADQPPVIDTSLVNTQVLVGVKPYDHRRYTPALVRSVSDKGVVKVDFTLEAERRGTAHVPGHCIRVLAPLKKFELKLMLNARFREKVAQKCREAGDCDTDNEVAAINAHAGLPAVEHHHGHATPMFNRDLETRTPNRIFRTSSTRTPGTFIPGNGDETKNFLKGDLLCLGNGSRKRFNGSQWRSLCTHSVGCDRESQRCGSCSLHSKGDTKKQGDTSPYSRSVTVTPSREQVSVAPDRLEEEAAHGLLELSKEKDKTPHSAPSSMSVATPPMYNSHVSPVFGAAAGMPMGAMSVSPVVPGPGGVLHLPMPTYTCMYSPSMPRGQSMPSPLMPCDPSQLTVLRPLYPIQHGGSTSQPPIVMVSPSGQLPAPQHAGRMPAPVPAYQPAAYPGTLEVNRPSQVIQAPSNLMAHTGTFSTTPQQQVVAYHHSFAPLPDVNGNQNARRPAENPSQSSSSAEESPSVASREGGAVESSRPNGLELIVSSSMGTAPVVSSVSSQLSKAAGRQEPAFSDYQGSDQAKSSDATHTPPYTPDGSKVPKAHVDIIGNPNQTPAGNPNVVTGGTRRNLLFPITNPSPASQLGDVPMQIEGVPEGYTSRSTPAKAYYTTPPACENGNTLSVSGVKEKAAEQDARSSMASASMP